MRERRLTIALFVLAALLAAAIVYIYSLQRHLNALSPESDERELVERAAQRLTRDGGGSADEWLNGTYPVVMRLDRGRTCVDLRPRSRYARSGLVCFGTDGQPELEIVHGPPFP